MCSHSMTWSHTMTGFGIYCFEGMVWAEGVNGVCEMCSLYSGGVKHGWMKVTVFV